jgi:hypothetical protein
MTRRLPPAASASSSQPPADRRLTGLPRGSTPGRPAAARRGRREIRARGVSRLPSRQGVTPTMRVGGTPAGLIHSFPSWSSPHKPLFPRCSFCVGGGGTKPTEKDHDARTDAYARRVFGRKRALNAGYTVTFMPKPITLLGASTRRLSSVSTTRTKFRAKRAWVASGSERAAICPTRKAGGLGPATRPPAFHTYLRRVGGSLGGARRSSGKRPHVIHDAHHGSGVTSDTPLGV